MSSAVAWASRFRREALKAKSLEQQSAIGNRQYVKISDLRLTLGLRLINYGGMIEALK